MASRVASGQTPPRELLLKQFEAFDRQVAADSASRPLRNNDSGGLAWGASYVLTAYAEMIAATEDPRYAARFVTLADGVLALRDDRRNVKDEFRGKVVPAWSSTKYTKDKRYAWAVHTGMLTYPMARFSAVVLGSDTLRPSFEKDARRILAAVLESVAVHDAEWRDGPKDGEGYLYCLHLKKYLPLNQQNALGRTWIALDDALKHAGTKSAGATGGSPASASNSSRGKARADKLPVAPGRFRGKVEKLARFFKRRLRHDEKLDAYGWAYWPGLDNKGKGAEDISHAAINADFAVLCHQRGIVFDKQDMARFKATLTKRVWTKGGAIANTVEGEGKGRYADAIHRWARLGSISKTTRDRFVYDLRARKKTPGMMQAISIAHTLAALAE